MHRYLRRGAIALGAVAGILAAGGAAAYAVSAGKLAEKHPVPSTRLAIRADSAAIARGEHLATTVAKCGACHGDRLEGKRWIDAGPLGVLYTPNLTRGKGGIGARYTDADWERAIRHGVRPDSTSLLVMPSEDYAIMTDEDASALIAYLKGVPAADHEVPRTHLRPLGRVLLAVGQLGILSAENAARAAKQYATAAPPGPTKEYGAYLARVGGCTGCHGPGLSGGRHPGQPESEPAAANITPAAIGDWTEAEFVRAMREGTRPDGSTISDFMPWRTTGKMSDDELRALWRYLESVPPRASGNH